MQDDTIGEFRFLRFIVIIHLVRLALTFRMKGCIYVFRLVWELGGVREPPKSFILKFRFFHSCVQVFMTSVVRCLPHFALLTNILVSNITYIELQCAAYRQAKKAAGDHSDRTRND